jgi:hypothetical protein
MWPSSCQYSIFSFSEKVLASSHRYETAFFANRDPAVAIVTPEQTEFVRQSFDAIWSIRRELADQFYRRFSELAPDAQDLFRSDMERQYLKSDGHDRCHCWYARQARHVPLGVSSGRVTFIYSELELKGESPPYQSSSPSVATQLKPDLLPVLADRGQSHSGTLARRALLTRPKLCQNVTPITS